MTRHLLSALFLPLVAGSAAASPCALPEICVPATKQITCKHPWAPISATKELKLSQYFDVHHAKAKVAEIDPNWMKHVRPGEQIPTRWRIIWDNAASTLVHTATLEESAIIECVKGKLFLSVQRTAWVTSFQDQASPAHHTSTEVRPRIKRDHLDLSKGKVISPVFKSADSRIESYAPTISSYFELIHKEFPTGLSFRKARNLFDPAFEEFLRFDGLLGFSYWTNPEQTLLLLVNEKGQALARFQRVLSPFRYSDSQNRFTNSVEQELRAAQAYLQGLEGTPEKLPLMEPENFAAYRPLAALLETALAVPTAESVAALHSQVKQGAWPEISKDLPLVEVGAWVKGFVDHVEAAYRATHSVPAN
jgi:hypothetical protein